MKNICDYMIIQRDADGFGKGIFAGEISAEGDFAVAVRVMNEYNNQTVIPWHKCALSGKKWQDELTIPEGGLYRVEARLAPQNMPVENNRFDWCDLIACANHVGVGDVYIMAGQSNMSGYGKDPAFDPPQLGVHLFDNSGNWVLACHPLNSVPNPAYKNNDTGSGTSPALAFGKMMQRKLGVPVGLVAAARGGSSLEDWNPAHDDDPYLYYALQEKIADIGSFKGMIWYQGCNDATNLEEATIYLEKFKQTVSLWREEFGYFPIVTCQINRHAFKADGDDRFWGMVREAQRQAAFEIDGVEVIPTIDMHTVDGIHNTSAACIAIGERLAFSMLRALGERGGLEAPNLKSVKRTGADTVQLTFAGRNHMLRTMDDLADGINIEDEKGMMNCVRISVNNDGAEVQAEREIVGKAVFHAYWKRNVPSFFIRDIYGMPMLACYGVEIEE